MKAAMHLPVLVEDLPSSWAFQPDGCLRDKVRHAVEIGVVKIIAGPEKCHAVIDIKRPYFLPIEVPFVDLGGMQG